MATRCGNYQHHRDERVKDIINIKMSLEHSNRSAFGIYAFARSVQRRKGDTDTAAELRSKIMEETILRKDDPKRIRRHFEEIQIKTFSGFAAGQIRMPPGAQENFLPSGTPVKHFTISEMLQKRKNSEKINHILKRTNEIVNMIAFERIVHQNPRNWRKRKI